MFKLFDPAQGGNESLLLHDVNGELVRVTQDGGNPNITVFDWSRTPGYLSQSLVCDVTSGVSDIFAHRE